MSTQETVSSAFSKEKSLEESQLEVVHASCYPALLYNSNDILWNLGYQW